MHLRWTAPAAEDLYAITSRIVKDNPVAATRVAQVIYDGCANPSGFPRRGRPGSKEGTRELVFPGLPYIAVYRVGDSFVEILRVYHGAQDRR